MSDVRIRLEEVVGMPEFVREISEAPGHEQDHCRVVWRTRQDNQAGSPRVTPTRRANPVRPTAVLATAVSILASRLTTLATQVAVGVVQVMAIHEST